MPLRLFKKLGEALRVKIAPKGDAQSKPVSRTPQSSRPDSKPSQRAPQRAPRQAQRRTPDEAPRPAVEPARQQRPARPAGRRPDAPQPAPSRHARNAERSGDRRNEERPRLDDRPRRGSPTRRDDQPRHNPERPVRGPVAAIPAAQADAPLNANPWTPADFPVPVEEGRTRFHDFDLPNEILHAIADLDFKYCTPIQAASLKQALAGANVAGRAQTGTGKTAAFLVAILSRYLRSPASRADKPATPRALVIAPTRELCVQICNDAKDLGKYCGLRSLAVFGGMDYARQQRQLADGPVDLLAATPGRLLDFQRQRIVDLSRVDTLVIDEADRMLDMGFIPDVRRIIRSLPDKDHRQTLLYSATLSDEVMNLAAQWMPNPVKVEIEPDHVASDSIEQIVYIVTSAKKFTLLCNLLNQHRDERVLIFGNRRMSTDRLAMHLHRQGFPCELLSGDVQQNRRMHVLEDFRSGAVKIVVATDVAGRGLHIADIGLVVNFELPYEAEDYVHRIGRTGRAGKIGIAVSFACEDESFQIPEIEKFLGETLKCTVPEDALLEPLPPPSVGAWRGRREDASRSTGADRSARPLHGSRPGNGGRGDRPRDDRPRDDRPPREERPQAERPPRDDRPREDRPPREERPQAERPPRDDRPREDRPPREERPQAERPPRDDHPRDDRPPREECPQAERPPRDDRRPRDERLQEDSQPRSDRSQSNRQSPPPSQTAAKPPQSAPQVSRSDRQSAPRRDRPPRHDRYEPPAPPARAIPPPSAATQPSHAQTQTWEPGGGDKSSA